VACLCSVQSTRLLTVSTAAVIALAAFEAYKTVTRHLFTLTLHYIKEYFVPGLQGAGPVRGFLLSFLSLLPFFPLFPRLGVAPQIQLRHFGERC